MGIVATILVTATAACGSPAGQYVDGKYGFSFKIPTGWSSSSVTSTVQDGYHVQFTSPPLLVVVAPTTDPQLNYITNGEVQTHAQNQQCLHICFFKFATVDGFHAVEIRQGTKPVFFADYYYFNSKRYLYQIDLRTSQISPRLKKQFDQLVSTFKVGANG